MVIATEHPYIVKNPAILGGEPVLKGTRTPIRAVAELWKWGRSPEEILEDYAHLTLAQVFDALSYYSDHKREIERFIKSNASRPTK